jgi:hypothetical protein
MCDGVYKKASVDTVLYTSDGVLPSTNDVRLMAYVMSLRQYTQARQLRCCDSPTSRQAPSHVDVPG